MSPSVAAPWAIEFAAEEYPLLSPTRLLQLFKQFASNVYSEIHQLRNAWIRHCDHQHIHDANMRSEKFVERIMHCAKFDDIEGEYLDFTEELSDQIYEALQKTPTSERLVDADFAKKMSEHARLYVKLHHTLYSEAQILWSLARG